jgi:hypothetical protein
MAKIFKTFKAKNTNFDITGENYNLFGLHKKEYFDSLGDLTKIELYTDYDAENDIYTGLAIKEDRAYTRDSSTGLLNTRITNITWYDIDGGINYTKSNITKYFSAKKGFVANKRARQNLIDNASMYLYSELMIANLGDKTATDLQVDDFESLTDSAQSKYVKSNMTPLMDIITNSTDNTKPEYRAYITEAIKTVLLSILNVSYAG